MQLSIFDNAHIFVVLLTLYNGKLRTSQHEVVVYILSFIPLQYSTFTVSADVHQFNDYGFHSFHEYNQSVFFALMGSDF